MAKLFSKIKRNVSEIKKSYIASKTFSGKLAKYKMLSQTSSLLGMRKMSGFYNKKKDTFILDYLADTLSDVINKHRNDEYQGEMVNNAPIWVCWWTGEDSAPDLVKQCIKSIRKNAGSHPVIMITEKTYGQYLDIPDYILSKVNNGTMCIANFSDYLRASLLANYGGLWLDATIFCSREIPESYFKMALFTCKHFCENSSHLSASRWTSFCIGGWKIMCSSVFLRKLLSVIGRKKIYQLIICLLIILYIQHTQVFLS